MSDRKRTKRQTTIYKTLHRKLGCSGRVGSSFSTSDTSNVNEAHLFILYSIYTSNAWQSFFLRFSMCFDTF